MMKTGFLRGSAAAFISALCAGGAIGQSQDVATAPVIGKTYAESREGVPPAPPDVRGLPNIVWILLHDAGFGASSAFGGEIPTPAFERLANEGVRYTNFHTTAICSPTRAALMTGRNSHAVGMGLFPHKILSAEFPGYTGRLKPQDGTIAEYLRERGYSTYALGKWHLTPDAETTDLGPLGKGFDHFFGFLGGATDQYQPDLVEDGAHVKPDGRHLNAQLTDKAIAYVDRQLQLAPGKPFFIYYATGAVHSPHQVDQVWLDKYRGKFDAGWDVYREHVFKQQKALGLIPANATLPPRSPRVPAWSTLSADQKKVYTRFMEGYAAFYAYTDYEIGRFVDHLRDKGLLDNTALFAILGDNGASKEGGPNGSLVSELGGGAKLDVNSLIVHWPRGISARGEVRTQYGHVNDLLPTTLEIVGAKVPAAIHGIAQTPVQGTSLVYSFADAAAPSRHVTQYYFMLGTGAIVHDGWKAEFGYRPNYVDIYGTYPPPLAVPNNAGHEVWELYDLNTDFNETRNVAARHPARLEELKKRFDAEARANNVYPLFNWSDADRKMNSRMVPR